jgi:uncharacterized protein (TIRG00374 family)
MDLVGCSDLEVKTGLERRLVLSVAAAAAVYLGFALYSGWSEVIGSLGKVDVGAVATLLLLSLVNYGLRFVRWHWYLKRAQHNLPLSPALRIYIAGFGLTTTPGKLGEMVRAAMLKPYGIGVALTFAVFLAERLSDLMAILIMASLGLLQHPGLRAVVIISALVCLAVLLAVSYRPFLQAVTRFSNDRSHLRTGRLLARLVDVTGHFGACFAPAPMLFGLVLALAAWGAEGLGLYVLLDGMGYSMPLVQPIFVYAVAMLIGALSFLPGGLGSSEVVMIGLLASSGVGMADAVSATIIVRLCTLWFAVLLGLIALSVPQEAHGSSSKRSV